MKGVKGYTFFDVSITLMKKNKKPLIGIEPNNSTSAKIIGIIFLIWFFGSMACMIYFSKINSYYTIMFFGQYFLVFGMIVFFAKGTKKLIGVPFTLVGLACIIIPYLMMNPNVIEVTINWDNVIILLCLSAFVIAGLCLIIMPIVHFKKLQKVCTITVPSIIVDHTTTYGKNGKILYCPIYEFYFQNNTYQVSNNLYTNISVNPKGTIKNIKINPDNPEQFLEKNNLNYILIILGICFLIISGSIFIYVILNVNFIK